MPGTWPTSATSRSSRPSICPSIDPQSTPSFTSSRPSPPTRSTRSSQSSIFSPAISSKQQPEKTPYRGYFIDEAAETKLIEEYRQKLRVKMANDQVAIGTLSGGNQQKVILARCMALKPKVLIVDEPTRGIDVGAKAEVHQVLFDMSRTGIAVIVISSELPEVMAVSDHIVTFREGRITGVMAAAEATEEKLMQRMALGAGEHHVHAEAA